MLKRPHYIGFGLVVLLTLVILNLPERTAVRLKLGFSSLFLPLFGLAGSSQQLVNAGLDSVTPRRELLRNNEALRQENQQLRLQAMRWESMERENARLRQLLSWERQQPWRLRLARVVLREPSNWWRNIQVDLGTREGIQPNMPVVTSQGLVGRTDSVGFTRSQVVLLGDPGCKVAVRAENRTRDSGIIGPGGPLTQDLVELGYLSRTASLKPGEIVKTSGEGGIFPKGIMVGTVVDSQPVDYGLRTVARVKLAADLTALEEVWILVSTNQLTGGTK